MKAWMLAAAAAVLAAQMTPSLAADAPKAPTAQQQKMKSCNKDAADKALKGDERKAFMKSCLSNKPAEAAPQATASAPVAKAGGQKDKMKNCNKDAGDKKLKGDERKKFMSDCLKK